MIGNGADTDGVTWSPKASCAAAVCGVSVVAANYASATSLGLLGPHTFTHVVFCLLPISAALVAMRLSPGGTVVGLSSRSLGAVCFVLLSVSLILAMLPYIRQADPVLAFVAENYFFGGRGGYPWTWLLLCGFLPMVLMSSYADHRFLVRLGASIGILIGHAHNGWLVWEISHLEP